MDVKVRWLLKPDHTRLNDGAQNHLQTTWLLVRVLYSVEQLPHCDLLRLSPWLDDLFPAFSVSFSVNLSLSILESISFEWQHTLACQGRAWGERAGSYPRLSCISTWGCAYIGWSYVGDRMSVCFLCRQGGLRLVKCFSYTCPMYTRRFEEKNIFFCFA